MYYIQNNNMKYTLVFSLAWMIASKVYSVGKLATDPILWSVLHVGHKTHPPVSINIIQGLQNECPHLGRTTGFLSFSVYVSQHTEHVKSSSIFN